MTNKVLIVTVYNSENCGSYLQAYALQNVLLSNGCDVFFYNRNTKGTSHELSSHIVEALKSILKGRFVSSKRTLKKWFVFEHLIKKFPTYKHENGCILNDYTVVLGSDTIWNFNSNYFMSNASIFLGNVFKSKKVISYAASVANTSSDMFEEVLKKAGGIHLNTYLVRDKHTQKCLKQIGIQESSIVCDPSLLLDKTGFKDLEHRIDISTPYIVLYYFREVPEDIKQNIIAFAKQNNLKIVSLLKQRSWCDISTEVDPREMISYYKCASYVISDTFHGCAFAINFNIPFAAHDIGKNKVKELLRMYECSDRMFCKASEIGRILKLPMDTSTKVEELRNNSIKLLIESL